MKQYFNNRMHNKFSKKNKSEKYILKKTNHKLLGSILTFIILIFLVSGIGCRQHNSHISVPDAIFEKFEPISITEMNGSKFNGVKVFEVTDYSPCHYNEKIPNTTPHADFNPNRAYIIKWQNYP